VFCEKLINGKLINRNQKGARKRQKSDKKGPRKSIRALLKILQRWGPAADMPRHCPTRAGGRRSLWASVSASHEPKSAHQARSSIRQNGLKKTQKWEKEGGERKNEKSGDVGTCPDTLPTTLERCLLRESSHRHPICFRAGH